MVILESVTPSLGQASEGWSQRGSHSTPCPALSSHAVVCHLSLSSLGRGCPCVPWLPVTCAVSLHLAPFLSSWFTGPSHHTDARTAAPPAVHSAPEWRRILKFKSKRHLSALECGNLTSSRRKEASILLLGEKACSSAPGVALISHALPQLILAVWPLVVLFIQCYMLHFSLPVEPGLHVFVEEMDPDKSCCLQHPCCYVTTWPAGQ